MFSTAIYVPCSKAKKLEKQLKGGSGVSIRIESDVDARMGQRMTIKAPSEEEAIMIIHQAWHVIGSTLTGSDQSDSFFYIDPKQVRQGPYSAKKLIGWMQKGFFKGDGEFLVEHQLTRAWLPLQLLKSITDAARDDDGDVEMADVIHQLRIDEGFQAKLLLAIDMEIDEVQQPSLLLQPSSSATLDPIDDVMMFDKEEDSRGDISTPDPINLNRGLSLLCSSNEAAASSFCLYVFLDTNVLLIKAFLRVLSSLSLRFGPNYHPENQDQKLKVTCVLPWQVITELDGLKNREGGKAEVAASARQAINYLRSQIDKKDGFVRGETLLEFREASKLHSGGGIVSGDDRILYSCLHMKDLLGSEEGSSRHSVTKMAMLSNDSNLRIKSSINGIHACSTTSAHMPISSSGHLLVPFLLRLLGLSDDQIESLRKDDDAANHQAKTASESKPASEMDVDEMREGIILAHVDKSNPQTTTTIKPITSSSATPASASKPFSILAWADDEDDEDEVEEMAVEESLPPPPLPPPPPRHAPPPPPPPHPHSSHTTRGTTTASSQVTNSPQRWWHTKDPAQLLSSSSPPPGTNPSQSSNSTMATELEALTSSLGPPCEWILQQHFGASFASRVAVRPPWKGSDIVHILHRHFDLFRDHLGSSSGQIKIAVETLERETRGSLSSAPSADSLRALQALKTAIARAKQEKQHAAPAKPRFSAPAENKSKGRHWEHDDRY